MKRLTLRSLLATALLVTAGLASAADPVQAPFSLPALPYANNALEPVIDARTMEIHHDRHHKAYVDNLNAKVKDSPALSTTSLEDIQASVSRYDAAVRNNAGGHYNHSLFWTLMAHKKGTWRMPVPVRKAPHVPSFSSCWNLLRTKL
ncbi:superoxide dismutase [Xanthomonas arboricola]|nr:superoxide dismutase [Xanthomonas arboricola]